MLTSILAVYNWDNSIFENMVLPEGMSAELVIDRILHECAELNLLYSDPVIMKREIEVWSTTQVQIWTRLWELANEEYDPLVNYDRNETETFTHGKQTQEYSNGTGNVSSNEHESTYGFNSSDAVDKGNKTYSATSGSTGNTTTTNSGTDRTTKTSKGNIGVTTYQQMMKEEFEMRPKMDIYNYIVTAFKCEFCILVY